MALIHMACRCLSLPVPAMRVAVRGTAGSQCLLNQKKPFAKKDFQRLVPFSTTITGVSKTHSFWLDALFIAQPLLFLLYSCGANLSTGARCFALALGLISRIIRRTPKTIIHTTEKANIPRNSMVNIGRQKRSEGQSCGTYNNAVGIARSTQMYPSKTPATGSSQKSFIAVLLLAQSSKQIACRRHVSDGPSA